MSSERDGATLIPDIDCREFVLMVDELIDSDPAAWGPVLEKHLADCPPCVVYLQQMLDVQHILRHIRDGQRLDDDEIQHVLASLTSGRKA